MAQIDSNTVAASPDATGPIASRQQTRVLSICLINPRFEPSFWGFDYSLPLYPRNKRSYIAPGALPLLAALAGRHDVYLLDENVEDIDWDRLRSFDLVGVTGMNVQRERMKSILIRLRELGIFTVVGGSYAAVHESYFEGLYDVIFVGEAETTWPEFTEAFAAGRPVQQKYEQVEKSDMTKVPRPRYDLLQANRYACGSVQYSRGCPFQCEFCDIIVIFGRRPRVKEPHQLLVELDDMLRAGFKQVFIVDDNFIGNKKKAKALLRVIIPWQEKLGYPLKLTTEASIDLADDPELLELLYRANFFHVFIGIETPRMASLKETKKFQNTRGDSMESKLARIRSAGLGISAGFIVGFDNDDLGIFEDQYKFIQENGIVLAMVGMLSAIPKTPLYDRLEAEGRLVEDPNLNFQPKQMSREDLKSNYLDLVGRLYAPEAFLERYTKTLQNREFLNRRAEVREKTGQGRALRNMAFGLVLVRNLFRVLRREGLLGRVGSVYVRYFFDRRCRHSWNIIEFSAFMDLCVTHWHFYKLHMESRAGNLRKYTII